ncbi:hypothetical protein GW17_00042380 [Ensete ventricosum]|nr:hypothetical protein GW17_00042380 [Ensete ventricosum]
MSTSTLDATRAELGLLVLYLNKAEARDKICRAIQYGSKYLSDGKPGTAQNVDKTTSLARKVFRLLKVRLLKLGRLSASMKKLEKELKQADKYKVCSAVHTFICMFLLLDFASCITHKYKDDLNVIML